MRCRSGFGAALSLCVAASAVSACGGGDRRKPDDPPSLEQIAAKARAKGHEWQAQMLEDGDITLAEYDEGHRRHLACLTAAGLTYTEPERILTDGFSWDYLITWEGKSDEVGSGLMSDCFDDNLGDLELAMSAWGDWRTDPALLVEIETCVEDAGFDVQAGSARNYRELLLATADQGLTREKMSSCIGEGMQRLYPGAPFVVGF